MQGGGAVGGYGDYGGDMIEFSPVNSGVRYASLPCSLAPLLPCSLATLLSCYLAGNQSLRVQELAMDFRRAIYVAAYSKRLGPYKLALSEVNTVAGSRSMHVPYPCLATLLPRCLAYRATSLPCCRATSLPCYRAALLLCYLATLLPYLPCPYR